MICLVISHDLPAFIGHMHIKILKFCFSHNKSLYTEYHNKIT